MNPKIKDAVMASFVADALSLGVHWVYDTAQIRERYGRLEEMTAPELAPYHSTKTRGEFTHYGDQALVLLESVSLQKRFDPVHFLSAWRKMNDGYTGYVDSATKETLHNLASDPQADPPGSMSSDLSGAARIAPLALVYSADPDGFNAAARAQATLTHNQSVVLDTASLLARAACFVFEGTAPAAAVEKSLEQVSADSPVRELVIAGLNSAAMETKAAIKQFGQMCSVQGALPSTIHLIVRYETDLKQALVENIMAGGDSSARGLAAGFILGAHLGLEQVPEAWLADMKACQKIADLVKPFG